MNEQEQALKAKMWDRVYPMLIFLNEVGQLTAPVRMNLAYLLEDYDKQKKSD